MTLRVSEEQEFVFKLPTSQRVRLALVYLLLPICGVYVFGDIMASEVELRYGDDNTVLGIILISLLSNALPCIAALLYGFIKVIFNSHEIHCDGEKIYHKSEGAENSLKWSHLIAFEPFFGRLRFRGNRCITLQHHPFHKLKDADIRSILALSDNGTRIAERLNEYEALKLCHRTYLVWLYMPAVMTWTFALLALGAISSIDQRVVSRSFCKLSRLRCQV